MTRIIGIQARILGYIDNINKELSALAAYLEEQISFLRYENEILEKRLHGEPLEGHDKPQVNIEIHDPSDFKGS